MGIFPFQTNVEHNRMHRHIQHFKDFCILKGYKELEINFPGPWVGKNGKTYTNREEFRKDNQYYPCLIKDGICYGYYEPRYMKGTEYKDPWDQEIKFIHKKGYKNLFQIFSNDYLENINLEKEYFEKNGRLPRWEKDGKQYERVEILTLENYQYEGEPDYPFFLPSDLEKPKN